MVLQEVHLLGLVPPGPLQSSLALPLATVPFKFHMAATRNKLQCLSATNCNRLPRRLDVCECSFPAFLNWLDSPFSFQILFRISFLEITSLTILSSPYTPNPISHWVLFLSLDLPYHPATVRDLLDCQLAVCFCVVHLKTVVLENRGCALLMFISRA